MAKKEDFDEIESMSLNEREGVEAISEVNFLQWRALVDDPMSNPQLRELLESMSVLSPDDIRQIVEDYFDYMMSVSAAALRSLNKLQEMMDDLGTWDFVSLMKIFETKADEIAFREHEQDDFRHLTDADRIILDKVEDLEALVNDFITSIGNQQALLLNRLNTLQESHNQLDSRVFQHMGDTSAHFIGDEKERFTQLSANFDNDLYMKPCRMEIKVEEIGNEKVITETAVRPAVDILGNDVSYEFASRVTRVKPDGEIVINIEFNLDGGIVVGANSRITITPGIITKVVE